MSDTTICALCNSQLCVAKLLPCLHSFCLGCLENLFSDGVPGGELTCPTCEETFQIPDDGLSALPANSFVDNLLKMKRGAGDDNDQGCDVCDSESGNSSPVTSYCLDCRQNMCQHCASYHDKFSSMKGHEVVHIGPLDPITTRHEDVDWCERHANIRMELCCGECGPKICFKCYTEEHNSYPRFDTGAVADYRHEQMRQIVSEIERLRTNDEAEVRDLFRARNDILDQVTTDVKYYLKFTHFVNFSYAVRTFSCGQKMFASKVD